MLQKDISNIDVVILCGGEGKRLKSVIFDKPKILVEINGVPMLDIVFKNLRKFGFKRIILSVGHLKEAIIDYIKSKKNFNDLEIIFSKENDLLGTGGALKKTKNLIKSDVFLVINGDALHFFDFLNFYKNHLSKKNKPLISLALSFMEDVSDYGIVNIDKDERIISFEEKSNKNEGLVNAGAYFIDKKIFNYMPKNEKFSLEHDLFPKILKENCYGILMEEGFLDVGVPERYEMAKKIFKNRFNI